MTDLIPRFSVRQRTKLPGGFDERHYAKLLLHGGVTAATCRIDMIGSRRSPIGGLPLGLGISRLATSRIDRVLTLAFDRSAYPPGQHAFCRPGTCLRDIASESGLETLAMSVVVTARCR